MPSRSSSSLRTLTALVALLSLTALCGTASAATPLPGAHISAVKTVPEATYPGMQRLTYLYGPVKIAPGQNTIEAQPNTQKPQVPGYITRFQPDLVYAKVNSAGRPRRPARRRHPPAPRRLARRARRQLYPTFAAGEEKTIFSMPQGFGYHYNPSDAWIMNYMIHNLTPNADSVYIKYTIDFVPDTEPAAAGITEVKPLWMDVAGIKPYPVFDALKGKGTKGKFTFPTQASGRAEEGHRRRAPDDRAQGHDLGLDGRPPASGRALQRPDGDAVRHDQAALPLRGQVLRAGGRRVVGRVDDGDQAGLARRPARRRQAQHDRRPTTPARRPGTSRWASWWSSTPTASSAAPRTRSRSRSTPADWSRTATSPRTTTTAARPTRPARRPRHARRLARRPTSTSRATSTAAATSA